MMQATCHLPDEIASRVALSPDVYEGTHCWVWAGRWNSGNGYSKVCWKGKAWVVHRLVYTLMLGEIPQGLVLDHLCRRRYCCNPLHQEPVTVAVNTARGLAVLFRGTDV